jgi:hypothetical protein
VPGALSQAHRDELVEAFALRPALVVGLLDGGGEPFATRGWGVTFDDGAGHARVLLPAAEVAAAGIDAAHAVGGRIALNHVDIRTLRCVQLKGEIVALDPATADDERTFAEFRDAFFRAAHDVDMLSFELLAVMEPDGVVACAFRIDEAFDQTPGPRAGRPYGEP